jgi:RND superfamily putative drug exporter
MAQLARWCFRHRYSVIGIWLVALIAVGAVVGAVGTAYSDNFNLPGTESTKALELLQSASPKQAGDSDQIVVHVTNGTVQDAAVKQRISGMLAQVAKVPSVDSVTSPYGPQGAAQVSKNGQIAYATVQFSKQANLIPLDDINQVINTAQKIRGNGIQVELGGQAIQVADQTPPGGSEGIGILAAAIILFLTFGAVFAMLMPIIVALAGLGAGILSISLLSHAYGLGEIAPTLAALIGLGVGIDYALFIVTRYRSGLQAGLTPEEATVRAMNTSGRAVLFAGGTVVIALLGLFVLRVSFLAGLGVASAVTVLWTVLAAVTLLPAVLGAFGSKLLSRKQRRRLAADGAHNAAADGFWARWANTVARRKAVFSGVAIVLIAILAVPTLSLRLGSSDAGNDPAGKTTRVAYDLLAEGFGPGSNGPLLLVAQLHTAADAQALNNLSSTLAHTHDVAQVEATPAKAGQKLSIIQVVPTSSPQAEATNKLIDHIRDDLVPAAAKGNSLQVYVGGNTAIFTDFAGVLSHKLPLFIGVIVVLGMLLLMLAFRSVVVPLTAAVMNLLAAAASFGVVVAVFQWGWGSWIPGVGSAGPVEAFLPVIMLAILFGLSMDYQVFLVSRMHEDWMLTKNNRKAVILGQAETGRVITAAALIMICVFASFVFGGQRVIAEFGIGLASAVAIDAFILRTVLVPSLMHLFGTANWWLPGWLDRILPHLSVDPSDPSGELPAGFPDQPTDPDGNDASGPNGISDQSHSREDDLAPRP